MNRMDNDNRKYENIVIYNLFFRNFAVIFGVIYLSAVFVSQIGWDQWPAVHQYVQLFILFFIISTNFINLRNFYNFHYLILGGLLFGLGFYQLDSTSAVAISSLVVLVLAMDLIGEISSTNALMKIFDSLQYKRLSPKIVLYNNSANVLGTVAVIGVQKFGNHTVFILLESIFVAAHLYMYRLMTQKAMSLSGQRKRPYPERVMERLKETVVYALKSRLVIMGCALIIWSQVAKFFCDWIYLTAANSIYPAADEMATFIGMANLAIMGCVIFFQKVISSKITSRFSPATQLSFIPVSFLALSVIGEIYKSPVVGITINIIFLIFFRTLHMPTLKICLQSIDGQIKPKVFLLLNFVICVLMLAVTTALKALKGSFTIEMVYLILILMAIAAILIIVRFDGHYLRSLWRNVFKQNAYFEGVDRVAMSDNDETGHESSYFNPHHYFVGPYQKQLSAPVKDLVERIKLFPKDNSSPEFIHTFYHTQRTPFEKMILIINTYVFSKNLKLFHEAILAHKHMFLTEQIEVKEKAYQLFNLIGLPVFTKFIQKGTKSESEMINLYCRKANSLAHYLDELGPKNTIYHKRLKLFILLNWEYLTPVNQEKLRSLICKKHSPVLADLTTWLGSRKINTTKHDVLKSFDTEKMNLNVVEFVERYLSHTPEKRKEMQEVLLAIKCPDYSRNYLVDRLESYIKKLQNEETSMEEVLDILFLVEWVHIKEDSYRYALTSVQGYKKLNKGDGAYWKDFHMEFLKKLGLHQFYDLLDKRL